MEQLLGCKVVARALDVHIDTLRRWDRRGLLRSIRINKRGDRRWKKEVIDHFIENRFRIVPSRWRGLRRQEVRQESSQISFSGSFRAVLVARPSKLGGYAWQVQVQFLEFYDSLWRVFSFGKHYEFQSLSFEIPATFLLFVSHSNTPRGALQLIEADFYDQLNEGHFWGMKQYVASLTKNVVKFPER